MKQNTGNEALAIQSGGDTNVTVNTGLSTAQMSEILECVTKQVQIFTGIAQEASQQRLEEFKEQIYTLFSKENSRVDAFQEPDFLAQVEKAANGYVRAGDKDVSEILIDIIEKRSKESERTRTALVLNSAIDKSSVLTNEEFAAITVVFLLKYTFRHDVISPTAFVSYFNSHIKQFIDVLPSTASSCQYLVGEGCGSLDFAETAFYEILKHSYPLVFSAGFSDADIFNVLPAEHKDFFTDKPYFFIPCFHDVSKLQFNAINEPTLIDKLRSNGLPEASITAVTNLMKSTFLSETDILVKYKNLDGLAKLNMLWGSTPLKNLNLNAVGLCIGYMNAKRLCSTFNAELNLWVN